MLRLPLSSGHGVRLVSFALVALVSALALVALRSAPSGATSLGRSTNATKYSDALGDASGGPDIKDVNVSNDDTGKLHFSIEVPNIERLPSGNIVAVYFDVDRNPSTGGGGNEYAVEIEQGRGRVFRWNGTDFRSFTEASFRWSFLRGATFELNRSALGSPTSFDFWTGTWIGTKYADLAPNRGNWTYNIVIGAPKPTSITVSNFELVPDPPRPGKVFALRVSFATNTGSLIPSGNVTCSASVGGATLPGVPRFVAGLGICTWTIPASAGGKTLRATLSVEYLGLTAAKPITATVAAPARPPPPPKKLELIGFVPSPKTPKAGRRFYVAVGAAIRQEGRKSKRISSGSVTCRASVSGKLLPTAYAKIAGGGATCGWDIPSSARGSTLYGSFKVRSQGLVATKSFKLPVR